MREFGHEVSSVAVLTPYRAQLALLKSTFAGQHLKTALAHVEFATVDGFQVTLSIAVPARVPPCFHCHDVRNVSCGKQDW